MLGEHIYVINLNSVVILKVHRQYIYLIKIIWKSMTTGRAVESKQSQTIYWPLLVIYFVCCF